MELNTLKPAKNATKQHKRFGRGQGSGKGGTSTKGNKGAKSHSGYKIKPAFQGGQLPLQRSVPVCGFKSPNKVSYKAINLGTLQQLAEKTQLTTIDPGVLYKHGLLSKRARCKILAKGTLKTKLVITAHAFSASAAKAIKKLGGTVNILNKYA